MLFFKHVGHNLNIIIISCEDKLKMKKDKKIQKKNLLNLL